MPVLNTKAGPDRTGACSAEIEFRSGYNNIPGSLQTITVLEIMILVPLVQNIQVLFLEKYVVRKLFL